jgi:hypothetical protein
MKLESLMTSVLRRVDRLLALLPFRHFGFVFRHSFVL